MPQELQKYNAPELAVANIGNPERQGAIWEVAFDYQGKNVFYLTNEEKEMFLNALSRGANYVDIKGYVLSAKFITIRLCEEKYKQWRKTKLKEDEMYAPDGSIVKLGGKNGN